MLLLRVHYLVYMDIVLTIKYLIGLDIIKTYYDGSEVHIHEYYAFLLQATTLSWIKQI